MYQGINSRKLSFQSHYGPGLNSASNKTEYQESSWGKGGQVSKADNFTTICELSKICGEPGCLTTL
jgi:hypothetical protein